MRSFTLLFLLLFPTLILSQDSLPLINSVKRFAFKTTSFTPEKEFYTKWSTEEKPYLYIYASLPDSIKKPKHLKEPYIFCDKNEVKAKTAESELKDKGYHTFCYKTYANAGAMLNKRLVEYSNDAIAFIIFHELMHNYLTEKKINIPYEFNEALCDVIGNYGALQFSRSIISADSISYLNQIHSNEKIYKSLNDAISKINKHPKQISKINERCNKTAQSILKKSNSFQKDRFNYIINNAYLLKNEYYCKHYFLLKKILFKQKSIDALLKIIEGVPENSAECEKYLMRFL